MRGRAAPVRCPWAGSDPVYLQYHDHEWGVPEHEDRKLFEMLLLEGAQAGLSWITILRKREHYRRAFDRFDARTIAGYGNRKVAELLANDGIVRNRLKVAAAVENARAFLAVQEEFGDFDTYIWQFIGGAPRVNAWTQMNQIPPHTPRIRRDEQGPQGPRLQVRRIHDLLRLHAGHRDGERPSRGLLPVLQAPPRTRLVHVLSIC